MAVGLKVYVTVFLFRNQQVLLLHRAQDRAFAPGFYAGVGGKVHLEELGHLAQAALREVGEETGIVAEDIKDLTLEVVLTQPERGAVVVLAFFSGRTPCDPFAVCEEGSLHWVDVMDIDALPMIANAKEALLQIAKQNQRTGVLFGVCDPDTPDVLRDLTFGPRRFQL